MGSPRNNKLLEEIRNWNCEQLINALEYNGLSECCEVIRKKDIDGDSFLNLTETQLTFWRSLTNVQIRRLWSCMQQAKEHPQQFIPNNIKTPQTNKKSVVTERNANLQNRARKPELPENKPKLKPSLSIKRENNSDSRVGNLQNQDIPQRGPKPPMPLKPTQSFNNFQKLPPKPNTSSSGNTVKTGKVQTKIAERLENLFGQNQPVVSEEKYVPISSNSNNFTYRNTKENNVESEEDDLEDYENTTNSNSYKNAHPLPPNSFNKTTEHINKEDDNNFDEEEQAIYENNIQSTAPSLPPSKPNKIGKFKSPITEQLENLLGANKSGFSQEQEIQETEYFQEQSDFSSDDDEWETNETSSPIPNTPPPPPRPANNTFLFSKKPPAPIPLNDINLRPPISVPIPPINSFPQKPPLLPPSRGSFSSHESEYEEENIYHEAEAEEEIYEDEPKLKEETYDPQSPIYKVPRPNPQPVRRNIPPPAIISRPLPEPPVDDLFPLPPNVVIKKLPMKPPEKELPRPPAFSPPIPRIPSFHDHDEEEYDQVDVSEHIYRSKHWFKDIERREAVRLLQDRPNGSFIVRPSRKPEIECAFSVIFDNKVYNLPVIKENGKLQFGKNTFYQVTEIVERFQEYPLVLNGPNNEDVYVKLREY